MTRVFVVAPTPMMRAGLRAMLAADTTEVVGEAPSLAEAVPDLAGADVVVFAGADLVEEAGRAAAGEGGISLVVLSDSDRAAQVLRLLPLRGWAVVPPDAPAAELQAAVLAAEQGLIVLSLPIGMRLLSRSSAGTISEIDSLQETLTARELEVLELLSQGLANKIIARKLGISEHTVKFHVSSLYTKLGASSRTEAVNRGARSGLISF